MRSPHHTARHLPGFVLFLATILQGCSDQAQGQEDMFDTMDMSPSGYEDIPSYPDGDMMRPHLDAAPDASVAEADASSPPEDLVEQQLPELTPPGGSATVDFSNDAPFLQFADGLELATLRRASLGRELFVANWTPTGPGSRETLDGLGPLFIVDSCATCHPASGQPPTLEPDGTIGPGILLRLAHRDEHDMWRPDPIYGGQLQSASTAAMLAEGSVRWSSHPTHDGLEKILYTIANPGHGPLSERTTSGARRAPHLIGMGLLDAVPDATLHMLADPDDIDQDGISGRVHEVWDVATGTHRPGRFGWKALHSSLLQQSAGAFSEDMGLTSSLFPRAICTVSQPGCLREEEHAPDVSQSALEAVDRFLASLGVPERDIRDQEKFDAGRAHFHDLGCATCHTPSLTTAPDTTPALFADQIFWPYTDLLLHDMGDDLADIPELGASASEWRTPPLWGLRFIAAQPDGRFLHDGRARNLDEAILWHGGEALMTRDRYKNLSTTQRDELIAFLLGI